MLSSLLFTFLLAGVDPVQANQQLLVNEGSDFPLLNFSSSSPLIFHSVFGLLQQWPNTFFEFGHTIAPCRIPKNTNLYHASPNSDPLPNPEWFAFDPQMAYAILGILPDSHLHTFRTQREVQALYFDGSSASLWHDGDTESQMAFIYNSSANIPDKPIMDVPPEWRNFTGNQTIYDYMALEHNRANALCAFIHDRGLGGLGWGYEGIIRMNAGFEMIWCNFTSPSIKLISWLNVSAPPLDDWAPFKYRSLLKTPLGIRSGPFTARKQGFPIIDNPFISSSQFAWFSAASKRFGFGNGAYGSGETRVKPDNCALSTYYDPELHDQENARIRYERDGLNLTIDGFWHSPTDKNERAEALEQLTRRRREQRVANVSISDGLHMRRTVEKRMRATLTQGEDRHCSGIDWVNTAREIVSSCSVELFSLSKLLKRHDDVADKDVRKWLGLVRQTAHEFYMPFYKYPHFTTETIRSDFAVSAPGSDAALERCRTQHDPLDAVSLSDSEDLTYTAIFDVVSAICRTMLPIFLSTERLWLQGFNNASFSAPPPLPEMLAEVRGTNIGNSRAIEELMAWLGWADQWTACDPACVIGEVCYIPTWPIFGLPELLKNRTDHMPMHEIEKLLRKDLWKPTRVDISDFPPLA